MSSISEIKSWNLLGLLAMCTLLCANGAWSTPNPLVEFKFNEGTGTTSANTGTMGGNGTFTSTLPSWDSRAPINGSQSLYYGVANGAYAVDLPSSNDIKDLKSFTIAGWINCKSSLTGAGGNRIVSWLKHGDNDGVDLAYQGSNNSLQLGIKDWNDVGGPQSSANKIPVDINGPFNNWRFFAVTYNSALSSGHVKFYFGTNATVATLDVARDYSRGLTGSDIASTVTIGHHPATHRAGNTTQNFKGVLDQIRVFGSKTDGSGALTIEQIRELQNASQTMGGGIVYERWSSVGGIDVQSLITTPDYPNNPTNRSVRSLFETPEDQVLDYGARMTGWLLAPETGNYTFWIAGDDRAELRLSTDANPANMRLIASVPNYTAVREWEKYPNDQKSALVPMVAGQYYYVEALLKQSTGSAHMQVGWQLPNGLMERSIPAGRLFLTPGEGTGMFPSSFTYYTPGTSSKAAVTGWRTSPENEFFIETEGQDQFLVREGEVVTKNRLCFGQEYGDNLDLCLRYQRDNAGDRGALILEGGNAPASPANAPRPSAFKVLGPSETPLEAPYVDFNQRLTLTGPAFIHNGLNYDASATLHYADGLFFSRFTDDFDAENSRTSLLNQDGLRLERGTVMDGVPSSQFTLQLHYSGATASVLEEVGGYGATLEYGPYGIHYISAEGPQQIVETTVGDDGVTTTGKVTAGTVEADVVVATTMVTTPKWRLAESLPDYVFENDYRLMKLDEVERFVKEKKHLPEVPSSKEMSEKGVNIAEMNILLLKKVEELTLHVIDLDKQVRTQNKKNTQLEKALGRMQLNGKGK